MVKYIQIILILLVCLSDISSQSLEPRIYSNLPKNLNFLVVGDVYSKGGFAIDGILPVEDFEMRTNQIVLGYARSLNIAGRSGQIQVLTPYLFGNAEAILAGQDTMRSFSGFVDPRVRIGVNIFGGPSLALDEFVNYRQKTIVGISLLTILPLGKYEKDRILNIGSNRFSFKSEIGISQVVSAKLTLELYGGVWLFTSNKEYVGDSKVQQDPIITTQAHLIYSLGRAKPWVSGGLTFYSGGKTYIDEQLQNNFQSNYRIGGTFAYPLNNKSTLMVNLNFGVSTRFGQKLSNYGVLYQYRWFNEK